MLYAAFLLGFFFTCQGALSRKVQRQDGQEFSCRGEAAMILPVYAARVYGYQVLVGDHV